MSSQFCENVISPAIPDSLQITIQSMEIQDSTRVTKEEIEQFTVDLNSLKDKFIDNNMASKRQNQ